MLVRILITALAAVLALTASVVGPSADEPTADALAIRLVEIDTPGPLGPITVFGDSVLLGSALFAPTLPELLAAQGWGPIQFLAGAGFNTGTPFRDPADARITTWIQRWRAQGGGAGPWIVNLGSNDAAFCSAGDVSCARASIASVLDALGPGTDVWWPMMTHIPEFAGIQHTWNTALAQLADERPRVQTWDWPAELAAGPYRTSDNIHLDPAGYRYRTDLMARIITARLGQGGPSGQGPVPLPPADAAPSGLLRVDADRIVDTRKQDPGRLRAGQVLRVDLSGHVPDGTTAAALYVTAVQPSGRGHLIVAPCGDTSTASSLNYQPLDTRGAPTITRIGADRSVCVTTVAATDVVVDLQAAFHPDDPEALGFDPLPVPQRLADTRKTALTQRLVVDAPAGAEAVSVNLTAVGSTRRGHVVAGPCDESPRWANLNFRPGPPIASAAIVEVGDDGTFCVTTVNRTHLVVDLTGTFSEAGSSRLVPVVPTRMLDSRKGTGGWGALHGAGQIVRARVAPDDATAVSGTITIVNPRWPAFLTGFGCVGDPGTSSVNAADFVVAANSLTTVIDDGDVCIDASSGTHTLFDTTGWWIET